MIDTFNIETLRTSNSPFILIYGKKSTGKTTLVQHIVNDTNHSVVTQTPWKWKHCDNLKWINDTFVDKDIADNVLSHSSDNKWFVIEDTLSGQDYFRANTVKKLAYNCQCMHIGFIHAAQFPIIHSPNTVSNVEYIFLFKLVDGDLQKVYNSVVELHHMAYDVFEQVYTSITSEPYTAMVIKTNSDTIFKYYVDSVS